MPHGDPLVPDLRIGVLDGGPAEVFGDLRAVEVDRDGRIYALDHQTSEVRVWVRRGDDGGAVRFDVFDTDGDFLRSIRLAFEPLPGLAPTVRHGSLYAVVTGEMGVQRIVRTRLSEF